MERTLQYLITRQDEGKTIDKYLKEQGFSRQNLIELKKIEKSILVDDIWQHVTYKLSSGEKLVIHIVEKEASEKIEPEDIPIEIVYEDEDILVVNKPANMPVHPSMNHYYGTLANAIAYYFKQKNCPYVFRCINRLDRDTTGLVVLAKHMLSGAILGQDMVERKIKREYMAIVAGEDIDDFGTIDAPIARKDDSLIERVVSDNGQRAVTHYKVNIRRNGYVLLAIHLDTGRTHQIRVHMKHIGHPLVGDNLYAPEHMVIERQALHSYSLSFKHPITKEEMYFSAKIPEDMESILKKSKNKC